MDGDEDGVSGLRSGDNLSFPESTFTNGSDSATAGGAAVDGFTGDKFGEVLTLSIDSSVDSSKADPRLFEGENAAVGEAFGEDIGDDVLAFDTRGLFRLTSLSLLPCVGGELDSGFGGDDDDDDDDDNATAAAAADLGSVSGEECADTDIVAAKAFVSSVNIFLGEPPFLVLLLIASIT